MAEKHILRVALAFYSSGGIGPARCWEDVDLLAAQGSSRNYIQWGEQVFDTLPILQVSLLTKHVEVYTYVMQ